LPHLAATAARIPSGARGRAQAARFWLETLAADLFDLLATSGAGEVEEQPGVGTQSAALPLLPIQVHHRETLPARRGAEARVGGHEHVAVGDLRRRELHRVEAAP
jgi:hypothetical protein